MIEGHVTVTKCKDSIEIAFTGGTIKLAHDLSWLDVRLDDDDISYLGITEARAPQLKELFSFLHYLCSCMDPYDPGFKPHNMQQVLINYARLFDQSQKILKIDEQLNQEG